MRNGFEVNGDNSEQIFDDIGSEILPQNDSGPTKTRIVSPTMYDISKPKLNRTQPTKYSKSKEKSAHTIIKNSEAK